MQPRETLSSTSTVAMATRSAMAAVGERGREGEGAGERGGWWWKAAEG